MLNLLSSFVTTVTAIVQFVIHAIVSLLNFLLMIPTYIAFIVSSVNVLPSVVIPFVIASIWVTAYLFIIGRN